MWDSMRGCERERDYRDVFDQYRKWDSDEEHGERKRKEKKNEKDNRIHDR